MSSEESRRSDKLSAPAEKPGSQLPSPRALSNRISHHHTLLHLAVLAEVLLQTLWEKKTHRQGGEETR